MGKKDDLKKAAFERQNGLCAIETCKEPGRKLPIDLMGCDIHRPKTRLEHGEYVEGNMILTHDSCHMKEHGILRTREDHEDALKSLLDDRRTATKLSVVIGNQLKAFQRRSVDYRNEYVEEYLDTLLNKADLSPKKRIKQLDEQIDKHLSAWNDPLVGKLMGVRSVGPTMASMLRVYVNLEKAPYPSSIVSYVGLDVPGHLRRSKTDHRAKARIKEIMAKRNARGVEWYGEDCKKVPTGYGGNMTLRTQLYVQADNFIKQAGKAIRDSFRKEHESELEGMTKEEQKVFLDEILEGLTDEERGLIAKSLGHPYAAIYYIYKGRLANSDRLVETRKAGGKIVKQAWKDVQKGHRHGAAFRKVIQEFLLDYWHVGRHTMGLPTRGLYVEEKLGHKEIVRPAERGWDCNCEKCSAAVKKVRRAAKKA